MISAHPLPLSLSHFKRLRVLRDSTGRRIKWSCISLFQKERSTFLSHKRLLMVTRTPDIDILLMVCWFKGTWTSQSLYGEHCYERDRESMKCKLQVFLDDTESIWFYINNYVIHAHTLLEARYSRAVNMVIIYSLSCYFKPVYSIFFFTQMNIKGTQMKTVKIIFDVCVE